MEKRYKLIDHNGQAYMSDTKGTIGGYRRKKIYGKLDCPSALRHIAKGHYIQHRVFFADEQTAIAAGYRPCAVCMPKEYKAWKKEQNCLNEGELNKEKIREQLIVQSEENYQKFSSRLLPNVDNILGVRIPNLRKMAKEIAKGEWRAYLEQANHQYFEELMIQGMVIGYAKAPVEEIVDYVRIFVPKITNWSVCDSFCSGLKITNKNKEIMWEVLLPYLSSDKEFEVRFAVVMLLNYYVDSEYIERVLQLLNGVQHEGYYAKMAVAWAISICYIKMPEPTLLFLKKNNLDDFTYHKALQKITDSLVIDQDTKVIIRSMKRK